ncbi:ecdysone 20-monooxygenase-like [Lycorma delicatula]|uniref:ecdysone 20-monooxygenase-like n=1 Tax=Lycorma delicatula TaxID=130591 RepID=UPI003F51408D
MLVLFISIVPAVVLCVCGVVCLPASEMFILLLKLGWGTLYLIALLFLFLILLSVTEFPTPWWKRRKQKNLVMDNLTVQDVPGPFPLPVLGTRWIYTFRYKMDRIHEAYKDMNLRYGKVVKEEALWNFPVISIFSKNDIEKVLRKSSKFPLRPPTEVTAHYRKSRPDKYTNLGLINEQGETWHKLRMLLTPELTSVQTMKRFLPEVNSVVDDFIRLIESQMDGNGFIEEFECVANKMGLESTCTLILGRRMGFLEQDSTNKIAKQLADAIQLQFRASRDTFYGLPFWKLFPTRAYKQLIKSEDAIYDIVSDMVDKALTEESDTCETETVQKVFMSILHTPGLDIRDRKAGIIDFIAAGIKTLGNSLVFLLYLIAKNQNSQKRLYEQIILVAPEDSLITSDTLQEAPYLRACVMEAFRILPTAPCIARILEEDTVLSEYNLKAGNVVLCHTRLACQDEKNFTKANEFYPERWLNSNQDCQNSPFLVAPFGVGKRMCPAKRFVHLELQVVLARIIRHFHIDYEGELDLSFEFLLAPRPPTRFIFRRRHELNDLH